MLSQYRVVLTYQTFAESTDEAVAMARQAVASGVGVYVRAEFDDDGRLGKGAVETDLSAFTGACATPSQKES